MSSLQSILRPTVGRAQHALPLRLLGVQLPRCAAYPELPAFHADELSRPQLQLRNRLPPTNRLLRLQSVSTGPQHLPAAPWHSAIAPPSAMLSVASRRAFSSSVKRNPLVDRLREELQAIDAAGTYKHERVIASPQGAEISVNNRAVLNFCANNYLGLSNHPAVVEAAKNTLDSHGFGLSSVRFICGTQDIHKRLEKIISEFHGTEDTILYPSCFDANAGLFEATLNNEDAIITDELNHASIIDGVRLCKAERHRYKHMDLSDLEAKLKATQHCRTRMIVTDGVFSMDGDVAPLKEICDLADAYNAQVFIDECHATGFFGPTGRGSDEYCGVQGRIDVINSTLGKALGGGTGGYTTGRQEVIDILRQRSRPYLFSNSLSPPVVGASLKVFEMLSESSDFVDKIRANTHRFRDRMTAAGFTLKGARDHPIAPVMIGDARLAAELADDMLKEGIYVIGFSYPVVPKGQARIRVQLSAAHSLEDVDKAVDAFIACGKARGIIN